MKKHNLLLACLFMPYLASAELIVVEDKGGIDATRYYRDVGLMPQTAAPLNLPHPPIQSVSEKDMLPVRSSRLSPGIVNYRPVQAIGLQPFFIVGNDEASRRWLVRYRDRLVELKASGLVVNVETPEALAQLRSLVPELTLSPIPGDDLAKRTGLKHYPVLISKAGIQQEL